jgi:hypothetical protein
LRIYGRWILLALALVGLSPLQARPSFAQARIGSAASISNQVEGVSRNIARTLSAGGEVYSNELVRTGEQSTAQLVFLDNTNLSVGPKSSVTLDRFVYDPDHGTGTVVVRATRGIFRFVTGSQPPQNYTIVTPIATIGVRGTVFDLLVQANKIVVLLVSGEVRVTPRGGHAVALTQPGTAVTVFATGVVEGPVVWHGTIIDTASNSPFPLFAGVCPFGLNEYGSCAPAPSKTCQWGKASSGMCVDNRLAEWTQKGTLSLSQLQANHNFNLYTSANPNMERMYSVHDVPFFQLFINTNP